MMYMSSHIPLPKKLNEAPTLHETAEVYHSTLGKWCEVGARTKVIESGIGDYSYIVNYGDIIYTEVGKFANIAAHFQYRSDAYELGEDDGEFFDERRQLRVTIGHDVWIGHGVVIQGGVMIGSGSVIGSGAVVTKNVPPYTIVTGVPATTLRPRFDKELQDALFRVGWWDWSHEELKERLQDFRKLCAREVCLIYDPI